MDLLKYIYHYHVWYAEQGARIDIFILYYV